MLKLVRKSFKIVQAISQPTSYRPPCYCFHPLKRKLCTSNTSSDFADITKGDPEVEHKLKVLMLEVEVMRQEGRLVPENDYLKSKHWKELLSLPTLSARRRYMQFLFKNEKRDENKKAKTDQRKQERAATKPEKNPNETLEEFVSQYDLQHNSIFLRIYETTMNQFYNNRLIQAAQFGQKIIVDCGYHEQMTKRENQNCAKQIMLLFSENRAHDDPYDLHLCHADPSSFLMEALHKYIVTMYEPWFPLNVHRQSYLDIFPKDKLVYLTPHCRNELTEYDHDAVYIIGGIVDKINNDPVSLAKAKKDGIQMAKLPLDKYLCWGAGSGKSLTLNQCISILLDMKHTGDWKHALRHVPKRKLMTAEKLSDGNNDSLWKDKAAGRKMWTPGSNQMKDLRSGGDKTKGTSNRIRNIRSIMYD